MRIKLNKEIEFNGKKYNELTLDLESLTGNDLINAEESLRSKGIMTAGASDFSRIYILTVASYALKMPVEVLKGLSAKDFTRIINETLVFLAVSDSELKPEAV